MTNQSLLVMDDNTPTKPAKLGNFFAETLQFVGSKLFLFNALKFVISTFLVLLMLYWLLGCYTKHGQSVTVPSLKGMTIQQAEKLLDDRGLNFIITDSVFDAAAKPMQVLEQDPLPNSKVKPSRYIYLTLNATKPPLVKLPNMIGKSLEICTRNLEMRGLRIASTETKADPATNSVLEVRYNGKVIKANDEIPKGAGLVLVVADGIGNTQLAVPALIGQTVDAARFLIKSNNLNLGAIICDGIVRDTARAYVYKQNPESRKDEKIRMGEQIDIWISANPPSSSNGNSTTLPKGLK